MDLKYLLKSYSYELPEANIAQCPTGRRDGSKLMVVNRTTSGLCPSTFKELATHLPEGALLVANNCKVIPARLFGTKETGGKVEFLLLTPLPLLEAQISGKEFVAHAEGLLRSSKPPKAGQAITLSEDLMCIPVTQGEFGKWKVQLRWQGDLGTIVDRLGHLPLPPYIKRPDNKDDFQRYQTVYANENKAGSVAAPTAGLHFTPELKSDLLENGFRWAEVTLYVGYGTFSPVRSEDIRDHRMHAEYIEISSETAAAVRQAKAEGRPVVAIGTTSARTLEGMFRACGEIREYRGETDIFIMPGYTFQVVDCLLTNFHLPESSLIIMVSALAGMNLIQSAYKLALEQDFRFFSYGDAMLIK